MFYLKVQILILKDLDLQEGHCLDVDIRDLGERQQFFYIDNR